MIGWVLAGLAGAALVTTAPSASVSGGTDITDADAPATAQLIKSFLEGNAPQALSTGGAQNPARSPFGNESRMPAADNANATLTDTAQFVIVPGRFGAIADGDFDGAPDGPFGDVLRGTVDEGGVQVEPLDQPFQDVVHGGEIPNSGAPPAETVTDFLRNLGLDTNTTGVQELNGIPVRVIRSPDALADAPLDGRPLLVSGGSVEGSLPLDDNCGGSLVDLGRLDAISGQPVFTPAPFAPEDLFGGGSQAIVGQCRPGSGWHVARLANTGNGFGSFPTGTTLILGEHGWVSLTDWSEVANTTGSRQFAFTSPASNPYTPDSTAYTSNMLPGLISAPIPIVVNDPYAGQERLGVYPVQIEFSGGGFESGAPCPTTYVQQFEMYAFPGAGDGTFPAELYSFGSGQATSGTLMVDGSLLHLNTEGGGEGFTEQYVIDGGTGTYTYRPGDFECDYEIYVRDGLDAIVGDGVFFVPPPETPVVVTETVDVGAPAVIDEPPLPPIVITDTPVITDTVIITETPGLDGTTGSSSTGGGPNWLLIGLGGATVAGGASMYVRYRKMGPDDVPAAHPPEHIDEPASVAITEEDLARYAEFGIDDHAAAQLAQDNRTATDAAITHGHQAQAELDAERAAADAARAAEFKAQLQSPPRMPDLSNIQLTDNPLLAFAFEFVTVMEHDLTTGRSRDRLAEVIVAMPDAYEKAGSNVVQQVQTAWTGWGEIFSNPASLLELDDAAVDAGNGLIDLGGRYLDAAEKDSPEFVDMTANLTANLQVQAVVAKGLSQGGTALANRLQGGVAASEATAASSSSTSGVRPPPVRSGTGTRVPVEPAPVEPVGPMHGPPNPVAGYGPGATRVPLQSGAGTPVQMAPNGCGAAVLRGIFRDLGMAVPREIDILIKGALQRIGGARLWNPNGGFNLAGMAQTIRSMLPATFNVLTRSFAGVANKLDDIAQLMAQNPAGKVMVGLRWSGAFKGGAGHWLRVEAIKNGWVALGDPATGLTIAIPANNLQVLAECAIVVVP